MQPRLDDSATAAGRNGDAGDLLVTGGSGFLGSQFIIAWLDRHPDARAICLIRADDDAAASLRLTAALTRAAHDRALDDGLGELLPRAIAIRADLSNIDWLAQLAERRPGRDAVPLRVVHCAANLSFRAADREAILGTNVAGTRLMVEAARRLGASEFDYVSTAYIAGDRDGDILEDDASQPDAFTNAYEESKWTAEALVRSECRADGSRPALPFRIFRPSIIIGHSITHRLSALSGFYKVAETIEQLGRSGRVAGETVLLPMPGGATLDLIPVDVVVAEMIALMEAGRPTEGHAFHLTSESPLPLVQVLSTLSPLAGFSIDRLPEDAGPASRLAEALMQRLRHYMPYLGQVRRFDRTNVHAAGIRQETVLDVERLRHFVTSFLSRGD
ncbi:SDR family oxidoreductase [Lichenicola sp.]|uniref:SDR family oxidoreductase n=1 Tax=Lichenicola sp. TaxID=2804529 RepID=UPI003AFF9B6B